MWNPLRTGSPGEMVIREGCVWFFRDTAQTCTADKPSGAGGSSASGCFREAARISSIICSWSFSSSSASVVDWGLAFCELPPPSRDAILSIIIDGDIYKYIFSKSEVLTSFRSEIPSPNETDRQTDVQHHCITRSPTGGGGRITTGSWRRVARLSPCSITDFTSSSLPCSVESRQTSPSPMHDWNTISHN